MEINPRLLARQEISVTTAMSGAGRAAASDLGRGGVKAAMVGAEVAVTIRRPRQDVAAVMFNPRCDAAWISGVRTARASVPGPLRRGTEVARRWRWFGRGLTETSQVVEHVADRSLEMSTELPFGLSIRYELEGIPEGTIARVRVAGRAEGLARLGARMLRRLMRFIIIRDLGRLKRLVESGAAGRLIA